MSPVRNQPGVERISVAARFASEPEDVRPATRISPGTSPSRRTRTRGVPSRRCRASARPRGVRGVHQGLRRAVALDHVLARLRANPLPQAGRAEPIRHAERRRPSSVTRGDRARRCTRRHAKNSGASCRRTATARRPVEAGLEHRRAGRQQRPVEPTHSPCTWNRGRASPGGRCRSTPGTGSPCALRAGCVGQDRPFGDPSSRMCSR